MGVAGDGWEIEAGKRNKKKGKGKAPRAGKGFATLVFFLFCVFSLNGSSFYANSFVSLLRPGVDPRNTLCAFKPFIFLCLFSSCALLPAENSIFTNHLRMVTNARCVFSIELGYFQ